MAGIPQGKIAATSYDSGGSLDENWVTFWAKFAGYFRASFAAQNDPPEFLPNFL